MSVAAHEAAQMLTDYTRSPAGAPPAKTALFISGRARCGTSMLADELAWSLERTAIPFSFEVFPEGTPGGSVHDVAANPEAEVIIVDVAGDADVLVAARPLSQASAVIIPAAGGLFLPSAADEYLLPALKVEQAARILNSDVKVFLIHNRRVESEASRLFDVRLRQKMVSAEIGTIADSDLITRGAIRKMSAVEIFPRHAVATQILRVVNAVRQALGLKLEQAAQIEFDRNKEARRRALEMRELGSTPPSSKRSPALHIVYRR